MTSVPNFNILDPLVRVLDGRVHLFLFRQFQFHGFRWLHGDTVQRIRLHVPAIRRL